MAEAIRGRISRYSFLGRYQQQQEQQQSENASTSSALRQNQIALSGVNNSLIQITQQINILSTSLQGISNQIKETSAIEDLKERQKARQEQVLAEQQIREGKESQVEKKIQSALTKPLRVVGAKAQGTLFNLTRFFNILLGGFLLNRIITSVAELSEDGKLSLKNLGDKIGKDLAIVGAVFLGINGGFGLALSAVTRLAAFLTRIAVRGLLLAPIRLAFRLATSTLGNLRNLVRRTPRPPANTTGGGNNQQPGRPNQQPGRPGAGASTATSTIGLIFGQSFGQSLTQLFAGGGMSRLLGSGMGRSLLGAVGATPQGRIAQLLFYGTLFAAPTIYDQVIAPTVEQGLPMLGNNLYDVWGAITGSNQRNLDPPDSSPDLSTVNINAGGGDGTQQEVPVTSGEATYLPPIGSSNPSNFYLLYSQIQYNVVG